eukprot:TRINITY_DN19875_c0_g1_i2.p1 TRINITY_DN19875_c0_g1~~TRINITY_DN19875_c0_g1_i2.p1  ORF type:complete len:125 (-),score=30.39 TRINITY_DN19875_c0_g1_i2:417-791(-)
MYISNVFMQSASEIQSSSRSGPWRKMLSSKDVNFVGYTYKNFEIVNDHELAGVAELKKKAKPKRPSIKTLFDQNPSVTQPAQGSFMNMLPTQVEVSESPETSPQGSMSSPTRLGSFKEQNLHAR